MSIYNQNMDFLSEVFMLTEFGNWIEQGLTWVIEHFDEPLWNITIVILLGVGLFFTITTGLVQLRLFPTSIRKIWFWTIPFGDNTCSLGVVGTPDKLAGDSEAVLKQIVAECRPASLK